MGGPPLELVAMPSNVEVWWERENGGSNQKKLEINSSSPVALPRPLTDEHPALRQRC